ncbi:MAG: DUF6671 family protein [Bacteroidales bacterium]
MMYTKRELVIATMHRKESVIAPVLERELGVRCQVVTGFDTDQLGTFSGEKERKEDALSTARLKCQQAMALSGCDLAIASEGSFGPHPAIFFVPADEEILMFSDAKNNLEIVAHELSTDTNFAASSIHSEVELDKFAEKALFPSHGLILRKSKERYDLMTKGITDWETLHAIYRQIGEPDGVVYVETDMRALFNPTRMRVIEKAAQKLVEKIKSCCPQCGTPGFGVTSAKEGLLCKLCHAPTQSTLSYVYTCAKCRYTKEEQFPHNKTEEDPQFCDVCNP